MRKGRFSEEQIIGIQKEHEMGSRLKIGASGGIGLAAGRFTSGRPSSAGAAV